MRLRLRPQSAVRDSGNSHGRERRPCTACLRWQRVWRKGKGRGVALIILTPSAHAAQQAVHETGGVHRCGVQRSRRTARTLGRGGRDLPASALHLPDQSDGTPHSRHPLPGRLWPCRFQSLAVARRGLSWYQQCQGLVPVQWWSICCEQGTESKDACHRHCYARG